MVSLISKARRGRSFYQDTIDASPIFPEMVQQFERWLNKNSLLVDGKLREGACWCTDGVSSF